MKNIEEMITRETRKLELIEQRIVETDPTEQEKLKRLNEQYEKLRNYIMGLNTALVYIKMEKGLL